MSDRTRLRETFDEDAELYDRARPAYPPQIFDDLVDLAGLTPGLRIVEIGPGTGQATVALAERGLQIVAVELGRELAAVARRKLAPFQTVHVVVAPFETWEPEHAAFDAVVSFTAFHWIDPRVRYKKAASMLRRGGSLGVLGSRHVLPEDGDRFFEDVQQDYEAVLPDDENRPPPRPDEVHGLRDEIAASGYFEHVTSRRYLWDTTYTAESYIALLDTFSGHRALDPELRRQLYERIQGRIRHRPTEEVRKTLLATLDIARALPPS
jgi:SAM-dependent methyltransferase